MIMRPRTPAATNVVDTAKPSSSAVDSSLIVTVLLKSIIVYSTTPEVKSSSNTVTFTSTIALLFSGTSNIVTHSFETPA